jgi:lipopolysaccharide/colanic/teichoic acid biosynthesis glycosyltransferase
MEGWPMLVKQVVDLAGSGAVGPLTPLFIIVALLIKLTSLVPSSSFRSGWGSTRAVPVHQVQDDGQDAERLQGALEERNEVTGPVFKIRNDPRLTQVGAFLRRTSIDELPQLVNVLLGDISLVGPRPLPVRDYQAFESDWYRRRFSVRPGMTCLWQVEGRSSVPFERWMELDMQYIDNWSLWLDFRLLVSTIPAVVSGKGAA